MKKSFKKITSAVLSGCLFFSLAACGGNVNEPAPDYVLTEKGEPVEFASLSFDFLGGQDVMPIGGFWGPYDSPDLVVDGKKLPELLDEKYFELVHEAGVNMIVRFQDSSPFTDTTYADKQLAYGEKYGIGIFPQIAEFENFVGRSTSYKEGDPLPFPKEYLKDAIDHFAEYDSFLGLSFTDEPFAYQLDGLAEAYRLVDELGYGDYTMYTNVLPFDVSDDVRGGYRPGEEMGVDEYFTRLFEEMKIPFISATGYYYTGVDTPDENLATLFDSLSGMRFYAEKYNIPLWRMLQAGGQWNDGAVELPNRDPYPSAGETTFDVNIALAYGCKAIQYFPLIQPTHFAYAPNNTYNFNRNGILGANGEKTMWYEPVQAANAQIAAIDHVLMNSASIGLIAHGEKAIALAKADDAEKRPEFIQTGSFRQLTSVEGDDCYIGCFDYKGGTALYVVNYDRKAQANISLKFGNNYGYEITQSAYTYEMTGTQVDLTLDEGGGALVVLK